MYKEGNIKFLRFNPDEETAWNEATFSRLHLNPQIFALFSAAPVEHAPLEAVYVFFDTATYNEIERDVKVKNNKYVLTFGFMQNMHSGDHRGPIGPHWRHDGPPHWLLPPQRGRDHLLRGQVLLVPQDFQGQCGGCC